MTGGTAVAIGLGVAVVGVGGVVAYKMSRRGNQAYAPGPLQTPTANVSAQLPTMQPPISTTGVPNSPVSSTAGDVKAVLGAVGAGVGVLRDLWQFGGDVSSGVNDYSDEWAEGGY